MKGVEIHRARRENEAEHETATHNLKRSRESAQATGARRSARRGTYLFETGTSLFDIGTCVFEIGTLFDRLGT